TGLGVVMVRAVRERRRTIGVLRALGFRTGTVYRSFMLESSFIALQGILLGVSLSVLTSWLLFTNSSAFKGLEGGFVIDWRTIGLLAVSTFLASLLVTAGPARRAARILPALAVRVDHRAGAAPARPVGEERGLGRSPCISLAAQVLYREPLGIRAGLGKPDLALEQPQSAADHVAGALVRTHRSLDDPLILRCRSEADGASTLPGSLR